MRVFKPKRKGADGKKVIYRRWYIEFWDHQRILHRLPGLLDKRATTEIAKKIERLIALRLAGEKPDTSLSRWLEVAPPKISERLAEFGIIDSSRAAARVRLDEHIENWGKSLTARNASPRHIFQAKSRVRRIVESCSFRQWSEIKAGKVEEWLAESRRNSKSPMSVSTSNNYLRNIKAFCNWMVRSGKANENPVQYIQTLNSKVDVRHERRALSPGEIVRLIRAAENSSVFRGITGSERALLYRLAVETGLRASEIRSLTAQSFDLANDPAMVTVEAAHSKHRRTDVLPLRKATAMVLAAHVADMSPTANVFPTMPAKTVDMIRFDLEAAEIPYVDDSGRYADFHALRHTFITNLACSGVHPKVAQDLARHSTIQLTLDRYTHTALETQVEALEKLPNLEPQTMHSDNVAV
ncbi:MAG: tyrosine-type recombinase/integrase [Planctomycetota bacterium]|jgi:integrase